MSQKVKQNALVVILILALAGTLYIWYSRTPSGGSEGIRRVSAGSDAQRLQFLALLRSLKAIKFDTSFFQDPIYQSLIDSGVQVFTPVERGRPNPFLPR